MKSEQYIIVQAYRDDTNGDFHLSIPISNFKNKVIEYEKEGYRILKKEDEIEHYFSI
jgi:hypothetical protein